MKHAVSLKLASSWGNPKELNLSSTIDYLIKPLIKVFSHMLFTSWAKPIILINCKSKNLANTMNNMYLTDK